MASPALHSSSALVLRPSQLGIGNSNTFPRTLPGSQQRVKDRFARAESVDEGCSERHPAGSMPHPVLLLISSTPNGPGAYSRVGVKRPQRAGRAGRDGGTRSPWRRDSRSEPGWRGSPWVLRCWQRSAPHRRSGRRVLTSMPNTRLRRCAQLIERGFAARLRCSSCPLTSAGTASGAGRLPHPEGVSCARRAAFAGQMGAVAAPAPPGWR